MFTRKEYCHEIINSLEYCIQHKGLIVYAWVIMPSHLHLIIGTNDKPMQDIVRDFKSYTSTKIKQEIQNNPQESRKEWLINAFQKAGLKNSNNNQWQLWQQHNQPIELWDNYMIDQKLNYLHQNPVESGFVNNVEDWKFSSAIDYSGRKGLLKVELI